MQYTKNDVNSMLNLDPHSIVDPEANDQLNYKNIGEHMDLAHTIIDSEKDLSIDEKNKLILKSNVLQRMYENIGDKLQRKNRSNGFGGGRALDADGKIRLYKPNEKIHQPSGFGENKVSLGSFLRAVVDKPRTETERTAVQNSVGSDGYSLPTDVSSELIDRLRSVNPFLMENGAGSTVFTLEGADETKLVRTLSDPQATWKAEGAEGTLDDPTFDAVTFKPNTLFCLTEISRELIFDSENVEEALSRAFIGSLNTALLEAVFTGTGSGQPTGLDTQISQEVTYANGGSPDFLNFIAAHKLLHDANVPQAGRSHIMAPDFWQDVESQQASDGQFIVPPRALDGVSNFVTSGSPSGTAYAGFFEDLAFGFRLQINLERFDAAAATRYSSLWTAVMRVDVQALRPSSMVRIVEAA